jgi:hypothetical protein
MNPNRTRSFSAPKPVNLAGSEPNHKIIEQIHRHEREREGCDVVWNLGGGTEVSPGAPSRGIRVADVVGQIFDSRARSTHYSLQELQHLLLLLLLLFREGESDTICRCVCKRKRGSEDEN